MSYHGRVVIGGRSFDIEAVRLSRGKVIITYTVRGPHDGFSGHVTVYGADGQGCWQGGVDVFPPLSTAAVWEVDYCLGIRTVETYDEVRELHP